MQLLENGGQNGPAAAITPTASMSGYSQIWFRIQGLRSNIAGVFSSALLQFNGDTTASRYASQYHYAQGTNTGEAALINQNGVYIISIPGATTHVSARSFLDIHIQKATGLISYKTVCASPTLAENILDVGSGGYFYGAITSMSLVSTASSFYNISIPYTWGLYGIE